MSKRLDPAQQVELDRQVLRDLLSRYTTTQLANMFAEEASNQADSDAMSMFSSRTGSTATTTTTMSDRSNVFDSASSTQSLSDASSITTSTSGSLLSNVSSKILGRRLSHAARPSATVHSALNPAAASNSSLSGTKSKPVFTCGFCGELNIVKTCTRKNDLKRHIEDFHCTNAQWHCRHRNCGLIFDWQTAYKTHLKDYHGGSRLVLDDAKVELCPQVVFACGFDNCDTVLEADRDVDAAGIFKEFVAHVVRHFDDGPSVSGAWTFNTRMRNFLRQAQVSAAWNDLSFNHTKQGPFSWNVASSWVLRKRLERRHLGDVHALMEYAAALGMDNKHHSTPHEFVTPLQDSCTEAVPGHVNNRPLIMHQGDATQDFNFRISRPSNPTLANYLASQRQAKVSSRRTQRAGYSSRSAGVAPINSTLSSSPHSQTHYYPTSIVPSSTPLRTPSVYTTHQQAAFSRAQNPGSSLGSLETSGGIIADDLQSLRNMADANNDVDMLDPNVLAEDFQHSYVGMGGGSVVMGRLGEQTTRLFEGGIRY